MKTRQTPMNQYQNLKGHLAHYNQVLRSKPIVVTRHKDLFAPKNIRIQRSIDTARVDNNRFLLEKLVQIRHRSKKSIDSVLSYKTSLKNEFKQKQKKLDIDMNNLKLYHKLKYMKSSFQTNDVSNYSDNRRRQRFSQSLHYQNQVYKTYTNFLKSDHNPRMFLRTDNYKSTTTQKQKKQFLSPFKVQIIEVCDQQKGKSKSKGKKKIKRKLRKKSQDYDQSIQIQPVSITQGNTQSLTLQKE